MAAGSRGGPGSIGVHGCAQRERLYLLNAGDPLAAIILIVLIPSLTPRLWSYLPSLAIKQADPLCYWRLTSLILSRRASNCERVGSSAFLADE